MNQSIVKRNRKIVWKHASSHRNLFGILKFTKRPKTPGIFLINMASPEGEQLLVGVFHAIMDKIEADILQIAKKWNWK